MLDQLTRPWISDILDELCWTFHDSPPSNSADVMEGRIQRAKELMEIVSRHQWDPLQWEFFQLLLKEPSFSQSHISEVERYANGGVVDAMFYLWCLYSFSGDNEVDKEDHKEKSRFWLEKAGTLWCAYAYFELSNKSRYAWENPDIYIGYMEQAANLWHVRAMRYMADFYRPENEIRPDEEKCRHWINMALQHGSTRVKEL